MDRSLLFLVAALPLSAAPTPKGLPASDWQQIQALHEQHRHGVVRQAGGTLAARNPGQQWKLQFDSRGFTARPDGGGWTWGLELQRFGLAGHEASARQARPSANANRVSYQRAAGVEEWFVNDGRGLEQGFTVARKPHGSGDTLVFDLALRGSLLAWVQERSISFTDGAGRAVLNFGGLKAWDSSGRELKAAFEKTARGLRYRVDTAGARYPVTVDPLAQQAYLKASNTEGGDQFGNAVAISGDTVVVGALLEDSSARGVDANQADNGAENAGAAYVFVRSGTTWTRQAYLKASNADPGDQFGVSVAISGDTVVVGALFEESSATTVNGNEADNSALSAGAAYVFTRSGSTWTQQAYLKASNAEAGDRFGWAVAISGNTVVVGAIQEDSSATDVGGAEADNSLTSSGAAYVYVRNGTVWTQQAYVKASNTGLVDQFGHAVAISGDTLVVGAPFEDSSASGVNGNQADNSAPNAGAAYVFTRAGTVWTQQAYLKASNPGRFDSFGYTVAISGDTVLVGAPSEASNATGVNGNQADNSASSSGAAYVFTRTGTAWTQQAYLKASNTGSSDQFGFFVALSGDAAVVGAPGEGSSATGINGNQADNTARNAGAAYVFMRNGTAWAQEAYLKGSNTESGDLFGGSVAISNGTVVVGARGEDSAAAGVNGNQADNGAEAAGAAYVFTIFPGTLSLTGGSGQTTPTNSAFPNQFQVTVRDSANNPIPNVPVIFTPPNTGASGAFAGGFSTALTNASGVATAPIFTANGTIGGPYDVVASIVNGTNTVNFSLTNLPSTVQVTVTTNLTGPQVTVNGGAPFTGAQVFTLTVGTPLTLGALTPQPFNGGQSRYAFQGWSPGTPAVVPPINTTYTANFVIQHQVTFTALPAAGGTITPAAGFYDQGSVLNVQATPNANFIFAGLTGALAGATTPQPLTVTGSLAVTANFLPGDAYQLRYMSNLNLGDSVINLTNTGARGAGLAAGTTANTIGAICANVYAFSPDEQMISCCSCPVTPNGLVSLSARGDLISNTLTPAVPTSIVVKLLGSIPDTTAGCNNSAATVGVGNLAPGLLAWGTTVKADPAGAQLVESRFAPATLSIGNGGVNIGELGRLQQLCSFINANGSGFGVCRSCRLGGLGAGRQ